MSRIPHLLAAGPTLSFEFFPPADEAAAAALAETVAELSTLEPSFVSVTCGAGGQGHDRTRDIVVDMTRSYPFPAMAHLTCVGHARAEVDQLLDEYVAAGVENILALAGDPPADGSTASGDFTHAIELVEVIRAHGGMAIGVAAHPEIHPRSPDRRSDRRHLAAKLRRADFAITQFFFDPDDYFRLVDELAKLGVDAPVVPGVFPVTAPKTVRRFAAMNNTAVPEPFFARVESAAPGDRVELAVEHAAKLTSRLLEGGAPGVHLYTMNRANVARAVVGELGLR